MRMLLNLKLPLEPFNTMVREGTIGPTIEGILEDIKPEAVYFTEQNGERGAIMIVDVANPSRVPVIAEPFFLKFNARCEFRIVMSPEELKNAGLDALGDKWR